MTDRKRLREALGDHDGTFVTDADTLRALLDDNDRLARLCEEACSVAERRGAAIDYLQRKVDGYEVEFGIADEISVGTVDMDGHARIEGATPQEWNRLAEIRREVRAVREGKEK